MQESTRVILLYWLFDFSGELVSQHKLYICRTASLNKQKMLGWVGGIEIRRIKHSGTAAVC